MAPGGTPVPPEASGREPPSLFFFLDLLPRWEKGFPSGPRPPWHGRGESPFEIGSVSLSLSVSAFSDSSLSPFLIFSEIRNFDWAEILTQFVSRYWLSCGERRAPTALQGGHEGQGRAWHPGARPPTSWAPRASSRVDSSSQKSYIFQKKIPSVLIPFGLHLIWIFNETKNKEKTETGTGL